MDNPQRRTIRLDAPDPWRYFLLVSLFTSPFWVAGSFVGRELFPGVPVSALMIVVPGLVAYFLIAKTSNPAEANEWLKNALRAEVPHRTFLFSIAVLVPPAILLASYVIMQLLAGDIPEPEATATSAFLLLLVFLVPALFEELGWSSFAQARLQRGMSALKASVLVGVFWAGWHVIPLIQVARSIGWIAAWFLATVLLRILIAWLFNKSEGSVLPATVFHASINASWQSFPIQGSHYDPVVHALVLFLVCGALLTIYPTSTFVRGSTV